MKILTVLKDIILNGNTMRIWLYINKTPLMALVSRFRRLQFKELETKRAQALRAAPQDQEIQKALETLKVQGYVNVNNLLSEKELQIVEAFVAEKRQKADEIKQNQQVKTKDFWIRLSDDVSNNLTTDNPFIKISLNEKILSLVGKYMGQVPFLEYVLLTMSVHSKNPLKSSQLWHLDKDNDRMLKMFIYFTDVLDDGDGPFTFLPVSESEKVRNSFAMKHLEDHKVFKTADPKKVIQMKGKKWTAFICDTSRCYHMGSRLDEGHERLMLTSLYVALPTVYPGFGKRKITKTTPLSDFQTQAIEC